MRRTLCLAGLLALALATAGVASASVIQFDPDGAGTAFSPVSAASFDFLPGNVLITPSAASPGAATIYYQARLGAVLDSAGHPLSLPGLNAPAGDPNHYEITAVFAIDAAVIPVGSGSGAVTLQIFNPGSPSANSNFSLYFDRGTHADDLAGTGFRDGTTILSGSTGFALGSVSLTPFGGAMPLDVFNPANYPGVTADLIGGGLKVAATPTSADSNFFTGGIDFGILVDTTLATPYFHIDPSGSFEIGPDGSTSSYTPVVGSVDGEGQDLLLESDGAAGFISIPEPASLSLLALGALPLVRRRRA